MRRGAKMETLFGIYGIMLIITAVALIFYGVTKLLYNKKMKKVAAQKAKEQAEDDEYC